MQKDPVRDDISSAREARSQSTRCGREGSFGTKNVFQGAWDFTQIQVIYHDFYRFLPLNVIVSK